jgi:hypothetical protein
MRRLVLGGLLVAVALAPASLATTARAPELRLVDRYPFVVRGQNFKADERVKMVLTTGVQRSLFVRAGAGGGFTVSFGDVKIPPCTGFLVRAFGVRGSRATIQLPAPDCLPVAKPDRGTR